MRPGARFAVGAGSWAPRWGDLATGGLIRARGVLNWKHRVVHAVVDLAKASALRGRRRPVLLAALESDDFDATAKRRLVEEWWDICEGWGDDLDDALDALFWLRGAGAPLGDRLPDGERVTVYRATAGEEPEGGSWTLDRDVAARMASVMAGPRGALLYGRAVADPVVWRAEVEARDVLAYFTERDEAEVVVPHWAVLRVAFA